MRPIALALALIFPGAAAASTVPTPSHCSASEAVIFSCRIKGSAKILSLCGSKQLGKDAGYLQYRFGPPEAVELAFPNERGNSLAQFEYRHYFRSQVDQTSVNFKNGGYTYSIYDDYVGDIKPSETRRGVSVDKTSPAEHHDLECTGPVISHLAKLREVIPCDKSDGLGECP
jgi:hypothetical protein